MKKIGIFILLAMLLAGCKKQAEPITRGVVGAQVEYKGNGETILRNYTKQSSVQSLLTYLRILRPFGPTVPEGDFDSVCRITLQYSDGGSSAYFQQGDQYLQRDGGTWQFVDRTKAGLLYPMLLLLPSDG